MSAAAENPSAQLISFSTEDNYTAIFTRSEIYNFNDAATFNECHDALGFFGIGFFSFSVW